MWVERVERWYDHVPDSVLENDDYKLLWDFSLPTDNNNYDNNEKKKRKKKTEEKNKRKRRRGKKIIEVEVTVSLKYMAV